MKHDKAFIYLMKQTDIIPCLYIMEYNMDKILETINNYSIESGATIIEKTFLGIMSDDENNRIISWKRIEKKDEIIQGKTIKVYEHKILTNEKKFIKTLINSFKYCNHKSTGPYTLIDFSEIYELLINKVLDDNDIELFIRILNKFKIYPVRGSLFHEQLLGCDPISRIDAKKNLAVLSILKYKKIEKVSNITKPKSK